MLQKNNLVKCGQCHYEFEHGVHVCQGCKGSVEYGATAYELNQAWQLGLKIGALISAILFLFLPQILSHELEWKLQFAYGLGIWVIPIGFITAIVGGYYFRRRELESKYGMIRTFRY